LFLDEKELMMLALYLAHKRGSALIGWASGRKVEEK
jgi:hypothetical protein